MRISQDTRFSISGSEGRDRTYDILINSQAQLPLCYFGTETFYNCTTLLVVAMQYPSAGSLKTLVVASAGVEPATHGFSIRCSTD